MCVSAFKDQAQDGGECERRVRREACVSLAGERCELLGARWERVIKRADIWQPCRKMFILTETPTEFVSHVRFPHELPLILQALGRFHQHVSRPLLIGQESFGHDFPLTQD